MRDRVDNVFGDPRIQAAFRFISENESAIEHEQIRFTEVAAPPFAEAERCRMFAEELQHLRLDSRTDSVGNVIATYDGLSRNPVVIAAHLDTVFPSTIRLELQRRGSMLCLPGISDNSAGIVAVLWALRAAKQHGIRFRRPVVVIGTVGEEGEGNLRGVRHVFTETPWSGRECDFVAVDGAGLQRITNSALGSRRFRIVMTGPGGHSWADFGRPNPVHAIAGAVQMFCATGLVRRPGSSFNFGVIRGGISVNAIPREATVEVDLRSTAATHLEELDHQLKRAVGEAARSNGVETKIEIMGERPSGVTPAASPVVQAALEVTSRFGVDPQLDVGSTDANVPIAMGIPAIAIGGGGTAGNVHTPEEWFDPRRRDEGIQRLLALVAALADLE